MNEGKVIIDLEENHKDLCEIFDPHYFHISDLLCVLAPTFSARGVTSNQTDNFKYEVQSRWKKSKLK